MPLYQYLCSKCGLTEKFFWMSEDKPTIQCPKCKNVATKVISTPTIIDRANLRIPLKKGLHRKKIS